MIPIRVEKTNDSYKITSNVEINLLDCDVVGESFVTRKAAKIGVIHDQEL